MIHPFKVNFQLDVSDSSDLEKYLKESGRIKENESTQKLEIAGEGNMNLVVRVTTSYGSFILKQSRPWVQKYPSVAAPIARINCEAKFYETVRTNAVIKHYTPAILWFDRENHLLCMEDFGRSSDFTGIYKKGVDLSKQNIIDIVDVLSQLHQGFKKQTVKEPFVNMEMRRLNHQHIFELPLQQDNGFNLNAILPKFQEATNKFRADSLLKKVAKELGDVYLSDEGVKLLHGDYYPGSWLRVDNGFKMIDPEFCFHGKPEFELAVTMAHLKMAQQPDSLLKDMFVYYHFDSRFDGSLFTKFTGMEIIRRLIGLAQLPLDLDFKERLELLDEAYEFVTNG